MLVNFPVPCYRLKPTQPMFRNRDNVCHGISNFDSSKVIILSAVTQPKRSDQIRRSQNRLTVLAEKSRKKTVITGWRRPKGFIALIKLKVHMSYAPVYMTQSMFWTPNGTVGVKAQHGLEINKPMDSLITIEDGSSLFRAKIAIKTMNNKKTQRILGVHSTPATFLVKTVSEKPREQEFKIIHNAATPTPSTRSSASSSTLDKPLEIFLSGRNQFEVLIQSHREFANEFLTEIEYNLSEATPSYSRRPSFEDFLESDKTEETKKFFWLDDNSEDDEIYRVRELNEKIRNHDAKKTTHFFLTVKMAATGNRQNRWAEMRLDVYLDDKKHCKGVVELFRMISTIALVWRLKDDQEQKVELKIQNEQNLHLRRFMKSQLRKNSLSAMEKHVFVEKLNHLNQYKLSAKYNVDSDKKD
ncbi:hypothetical protein L596_006370 [Steinernema carpocapsae]|uniref:Uncharacterized protein n=1 Tax=Steinernema carpocapsae TaxID=34508 RepID=A0A4U8V8F4_STECR|nr:hypothetical protein L596_006370 [Steinernema carpocapsae]